MRKFIFIFACCCLVIFGCSKKNYIQDENLAINTTNKFIENIMSQKYEKAYDEYLSPGIKFGPKATVDYFNADWNAIVDKYGKLEKATFDAWQTVPDKRALQLYYLIKHEKVKEPVTYHFVLEGHSEIGYTIFIVDIGNEQKYPPTVEVLPELQRKNEIIEIIPLADE